MFLKKQTLGDCILNAALKYKDKFALEFNNQYYSYSDLNALSDMVAHHFVLSGIKENEYVGLWGMNSSNWIICFFALTKIGAVPVLFNFNNVLAEAQSIIHDLKLKHLLVGELPNIEFNTLTSHFAKKPTLNIINIETSAFNVTSLLETYPHSSFRYTQSEENATYKVAAILFTSGSTSGSKGVMLTHYNIVNNSQAMADAMHLCSDDKICMALPLFHCFGLFACVLAGLQNGALLHILQHYKTSNILSCISLQKCTIFSGVPTSFLSLIKKSTFSPKLVESIRTGVIAGSFIFSNQRAEVSQAFKNADFLFAYGQTETSPCISMTSLNEDLPFKQNSVGKPLPHVEVKIINPDTNEVYPINTTGEILVKGYNVMAGYCNCPNHNFSSFYKGWLHTEDLGFLDEYGYLYITDRKKEIIIRGGENISPHEIENAILKDQSVLDVKVIGISNPILQEEIVACLIVKPAYSESQLISLLKEQLSPHKIPKYFIVLDQFPLMENKKINTVYLREYVEKKICTFLDN